jgi:hypothetical protein
VVESVAEKAGRDPAVVRLGETSESKPSMNGRKGIVSVFKLQRLPLQPFPLLTDLNINDFAKVGVRINPQMASKLFPNSLFYGCP